MNRSLSTSVLTSCVRFVIGCAVIGVLSGAIQASVLQSVDVKLANYPMVTDPLSLRNAAHDTLLLFGKNRKIIRSTLFENMGIDTDRVKKSLEFIIKVVDEDKTRDGWRIQDPTFLNKHFSLIRWNADVAGGKKAGVKIPKGPERGVWDDNKIKLTSYAVFTVPGHYEKTDRYNVPIEGYSSMKSNKAVIGPSRTLSCCGGKKVKVKPLVWLSHNQAKDALMQGTVVVKMPDDKRRTLSFHDITKSVQPNGKTKKHWIFREIMNNHSGNHRERINRIINHPGAVFAGDLHQLGLGKLVALQYKNPTKKRDELRIGILGDTGDAFKNNLYQLDLYAGMYDQRSVFNKHLHQLANTADAYFLVLK